MKLLRLSIVLVFLTYIIGACSEYNKTKINDKNEGNKTVYGEKGAPPRQMANKYESNPKTAGQVKAIKEKLYPTVK